MTAFAVRGATAADVRSLVRLLAVITVLAIAPAPASGGQHAATELQFDSWTTENGLPQNSVNDILQTRDGYLWLATYGGLVRFDGVRFVVFDRSIAGIGSLRIRTLHEDRQGTLWAGTEDGMLIRYRDGRFVTYGVQDGLPHASAIRIEEDDEGDLWITWPGRVTEFDGERFLSYGPDHFGNRVAVRPPGRYTDSWWTYDETGLHALVNGRVRTYAVASALDGAEIISTYPDKCGNLWVIASGRLIKVTPGGIEHHLDGNGPAVTERSGFFKMDCKGNVWFWDSLSSVFRVRGGTLERTTMTPALVVYEDREGTVWLGTAAAGLRRLRAEAITTLTARHGLPVVGAYSILEDRSGAVWIGTWDYGLHRYKDQRSTSFGLAEGLPSTQITSTYEDRSGRLWVGTTGGLARLARDRFMRYEDPAGLLLGGIWAIHEDRAGVFWFATNSGLVRSSGGRLTRFTTKDGLTHDRTSALFEDRTGALWIGTFQGLTRLKDDVFTTYGERHGLIGNFVRAIHEDGDGVLWIGTYDGGLYRFSGERFARYTRNEGLHDNGVFQILEDDAGNFWMGSNRGISRVSRRELNELADGRRRSVNALVFDARDGLANTEVNGGRQPAGMRAKDGRLWFPTMGGVAVIDPAALRASAKPPPAIIEEFRVTGISIGLTPQVEIPPDAATFEIRYTAPSFVKPDQIKFRYRLAGLDDGWIEAGDRRSASFFRIPPGRYTFEVMAASHDGQWGASGASIEIQVMAPFWRTWWFFVLAVAGAGALAFAGHHLRVRRLRRLHELQETFSRQLIHSQEAERKRVSGEMHDSLGQDLGIIKKLARARREGAVDLERVKEALDEVGAVADRLDAEMKEIAYGLRPHQLDTIGLSKTVESMVKRVGRSCEVEFTTDVAPIDDLVARDSHIHVFRIVQEAVSNIVKHSKATRATAVVARGDASIEIRVEDNGNGFSDDPAVAPRSTAHGFGLVGIRERARLLGGRLEIRSSAQSGTTVTVTIPFERGSDA